MSTRQYRLEPWSGRTFRRISLLAVAVLASVALFSVMAANASAKEQRAFFLAGEKSGEESKKPRFEGEISPTYLASASATNFTYTFQPGTLKCPGQYSGKLSGASSELSLAPFYSFLECTGLGSVSITANACEHTLTVLNEGPPYIGRFGVKCPTEKPYEFHVSSGSCAIAIPPQTALAEVSFANAGEGKKRAVQVTFNVSKLKHTISGPFFCQPGTYENGTLTGTTTLNGFNEP